MDRSFQRAAVVTARGDTAPSPRGEVASRIALVTLDGDGPGRTRAFANWPEFATLIGRARALPSLEVERDPEWLSLSLQFSAGERLWIFADECKGRLTGIAAMPAAPSALIYALGDFVIAKWPVRKFDFYQGPTTSAGETEFLDGLASATHAACCGGGVVFARDIPQGSPLQRQLADRRSAWRRRFFVLPWGMGSLHCRIRWTGTVEAYLASIGHESRRNLKRYAKKLFADPHLRAEVRRFDTATGCDAFLADGARVAERTYQAGAYGQTLAPGTLAEARVRHAAANGAFLGHILYVGGEPVAFHYGVVCNGVFAVLEMGYDPAWGRHHVGGVLFFQMLKDLERTRCPVRVIDYMSLATTFKLRTTNDHTPVRNYYLFPRTLTGAAQYATLAATDAASRAAGRALARLRLKEWVRSLTRRPRPAA